MLRRFAPMVPGMRCQLDLALRATSLVCANERKGVVEVMPEAEAAFTEFWAAHAASPLVGRNKLVASVCPELAGLFTVKLASLLMLCGGVAREEGGSHIRGEVHMLLVGDPGTGALHARTRAFMHAFNMHAPVEGSTAAAAAAGRTKPCVLPIGGWWGRQ